MFQTAIVVTGTFALVGMLSLAIIRLYDEAQLLLIRSAESETKNE